MIDLVSRVLRVLLAQLHVALDKKSCDGAVRRGEGVAATESS